MKTNEQAETLNGIWEQRARAGGADFVRFVDITRLPEAMTEGYPRALLFGKALSRAYIRAMANDLPPKTKEMQNTERKMDALAVKLAAQLEAEGYKSIAKLKPGQLPHKTVALRAGLGFIGKNNLLVTPEYGCAQILGKVLTMAPFDAEHHEPGSPLCRDCDICVRACPTQALLGKTWALGVTRDEILTRKLCAVCLKCLAVCPHTAVYAARGEENQE